MDFTNFEPGITGILIKMMKRSLSEWVSVTFNSGDMLIFNVATQFKNQHPAIHATFIIQNNITQIGYYGTD